MAIRRVKRSRAKGKLTSSQFKLWSSFFVISGIVFYFIFKILFFSNIQIKPEKYYVYADHNTTFSSLADSMASKGLIKSPLSLKVLASVFGSDSLHSGVYEIKSGWNNIQILYFLSKKPVREGVKVVVPVRKLRKNVVKALCKELSVSEKDFIGLLENEEFLKRYEDFDKESAYSLLIAGEFYTYKELTPEELFDRLYCEYQFFWNEERLQKCEETGLSPVEAGILASIVYAETKVEEEMPSIAGLYLNRLNNDMKLQADPTIVYAAGQTNIRRVLKKHKNIKSEYNTYRKKGLPPGPVYTVPPKAIDAVLNYEEHDYLFFCADPEMTGKHIFSETYDQHLTNARKYQQKLSSMGIYR